LLLLTGRLSQNHVRQQLDLMLDGDRIVEEQVVVGDLVHPVVFDRIEILPDRALLRQRPTQSMISAFSGRPVHCRLLSYSTRCCCES